MPAPLNSQRENQRDAAARLAQALAQLAEQRDALSWHRQKSRQLTDSPAAWLAQASCSEKRLRSRGHAWLSKQVAAIMRRSLRLDDQRGQPRQTSLPSTSHPISELISADLIVTRSCQGSRSRRESP